MTSVATDAPRSRGRAAIEWLSLLAALAVFGYVGWDGALWDARYQLVLHLIGVGAIGGLLAIGVRGGELPRTRIDLPLLGLLAAVALATASAINVGMSLRAMAAMVGFAAMLPVAILALRQRPAWVGLVTSVPILVLSVPTLVVLLARRLEWVLAGAPGLPPIRVIGEGTPFGSVAVPPFVLVPAWALAGLIEPPWLRRAVRLGLVIVGIPMTILSGSRSAWLAIAAAGIIGAAPIAWRHRHRLRIPRRLTLRAVLVGIGAAAATVLALALVVPRLTAVTSLLYRAALWGDTLNAWRSDPLLGIGPGFMPYARQAAAEDFTFPVRQPHSHNLPLGILADAGLVGLAAAIALVVMLVLVAGPHRCRTSVGRTASVVLIGLGIGGLFEDLTFLPAFDLLAIALVAVVLVDSRAVEWVRPAALSKARRAGLGGGLVAVGLVLVGAMIVNDAGAIAYRAGVDAAADRQWGEASARFERAIAIDSWHPAGPRALAVAADATGRSDLARHAAERATALNPGDATSWTNLALLCARAGDEACAVHAASEAAETAPYGSVELLNAATILDAAGEADLADHAYRLSLLTQPLTSFRVDWPRTVPIGGGSLPDTTDAAWQLNVLLARHAMGEPIDPHATADPGVRALAHAMLGQRDDAEEQLERAIAANPGEPRTWDLVIVLRDHWGLPIEDEVAIAETVRGGPLPARDAPPAVRGLTFDIASFRAYPRDGFVSDAIRAAAGTPYPWILEGLLP